MSKILVTGGAGFIGSHVCDELIRLNHEVVIIDNLSTGKKENLNPKSRFYNTDIRDFNRIKNIFDKEKPDFVNHHAAQVNLRMSAEDPLYDAECNIIGSLNLIVNSIRHNVKKFIYISSGGAVYGDVNRAELPIKEEHLTNPISGYGISKKTVESYITLERSLNYTILRYANIFGPRQDPAGEAGVNAIFITNMLRGDDCFIFGDGSKTRDYVYIEDIVKANILAMNSEFIGVLNIGSGVEISDKEVFDTCKKITKYKKEPKYVEFKTCEVKHNCLDNTLAKRVLNWGPKVYYEKGIKRMIPFYKQLI